MGQWVLACSTWVILSMSVLPFISATPGASRRKHGVVVLVSACLLVLGGGVNMIPDMWKHWAMGISMWLLSGYSVGLWSVEKDAGMKRM